MPEKNEKQLKSVRTEVSPVGGTSSSSAVAEKPRCRVR